MGGLLAALFQIDVGTPSVAAQVVPTATPGPFHGIAFAKGCESPVNVGGQYTCGFAVANNIDQAADTLTVTSIVDTVHAAPPGRPGT